MPRTLSLISLTLVVGCLPLTGCGGGSPTQADMMRNAIRRSSNEDQQSKAPTPSAQADSVPAGTAHSDPTSKTQSVVNRLRKLDRTAQTTTEVDVMTTAVDATAEDSDKSLVGDQHESATQRPVEPLSPREQRRQTIDNLQRLADALQRYLNGSGSLPAAASYDSAGRPLLSWRVSLLPYLGHEALYQKFRLDQPWDSPHNRSLIPQIPPVYQASHRSDARTNYLVPYNSSAAFQGQRGLAPRKIEDGLSDTVLLVEADDDRAVPWTQPVDYELDFLTVGDSVGTLRGGQFFVVWGDGSVGQIELEACRMFWKAMFSIDGGETFSAVQISQQPRLEEPATPASEVVAVADSMTSAVQPDAVDPSGADALGSRASASSNPTAHSVQSATRHQEVARRRPVPTVQEQQAAINFYRDTYRTEYESATDVKDRLALAAELVARANEMPIESPGRFVALDLARKVYAAAGDVTTALKITDELLSDFDGDSVGWKAEVLSTTARARLDDKDNDLVVSVAEEMLPAAIALDRFTEAEQLYESAISAARRSKDARRIAELSGWKRKIDSAKSSFGDVLSAIEMLELQTDDPDANQTVGSYYCFIKGEWEDGLVMLAQCGDADLAALARRELSPPSTSELQVALADTWWKMANQKGRYRSAMQARAVYWYETALPQLPAGLSKVKAELRIRHAE